MLKIAREQGWSLEDGSAYGAKFALKIPKKSVKNKTLGF